MTEGMDPTFEQTRQLNRSLTEKVLDRAASDPQWKQQLLDDPEAAMRTANFPEAQRLEEMRQRAAATQEGEVRGQQRFFSCPWQCLYYTMYWDRAWWSVTAYPSSGGLLSGD